MLRYFSSKITSVTAAAFLVAISSFASRILGVVRDRILAGQFGAGAETDIYYAAFRIPDFLYNLVVLGALSAGFIPVLTKMIKEKGEADRANEDAWKLSSNIANILSLILIIASIAGLIFATPLIRALTPGFSAEAIAQVASLTRVMFLSPLLLGLSGVVGGILQATKRFLPYSIAPIFYNLGIIIGALYLAPNWGLIGLAWGVVLGAGAHLLVQLPALFSLGFRYYARISFKDQATRLIAAMSGPRIMSLAVSQINLFIITFLASRLEAGSLSVFNFANNLQSFPVGIFGISFAIAAFPTLSEVASDPKALSARFFSTARQVLFFVVPVTVMFITLRAQIIRVVLGSGNFDWQDTIMTMNTLGFFSLSLFAQALLPLLVRVFYAKHDSKTPFYISLACVIINLPLSFYLSSLMGAAGLALAFSIVSILNFILLWGWLYSGSSEFGAEKIISLALKLSLSAIATGIAIQISKLLAWSFVDMSTFAGVFTQLAMAVIVGAIAFLLFCWLLDVEEVRIILASLRRRLPFKKMPEDSQDEARGL